jgi:hypothetical protein
MAAAKTTLPAGTADKVRKLLEALKERYDQSGEIIAEIETLLGGGVGIGEKLKAAYAKWIELHAVRYPGKYVFVFAKDAPQMKRLIAALGLEELLERIANYIRDSDPYLTKARHPFGLFVSGVNRYVSEGKTAEDLELEAEGVPDCKHDPPCKTDVEHTRRKVQDMRGGSHSGPTGDVL